MWIRYYTPIFLLQTFCMYHAFKNQREYYWFILILFLPIMGSLIYLYWHFYSRDKLETISEVVKHNVIPNYTVDQLIKQARVSDTITSKLNLADHYYQRQEMEQAMVLYKSCITGHYVDDVEINKKLLLTYYENERYNDAVELGNKFNTDRAFSNTDAKLAFAWSLFYIDDPIHAEKIFKELDVQYANHNYRYEYALFLEDTHQLLASQNKLTELIQEINDMEPHERRLKKDIIRKIKRAHK